MVALHLAQSSTHDAPGRGKRREQSPRMRSKSSRRREDREKSVETGSVTLQAGVFWYSGRGVATDGAPGRSFEVASWRKLIMSALTTRRQARTRILAILTAELDHIIPEDESIPLKGVTFSDFEDQVETVARHTWPARRCRLSWKSVRRFRRTRTFRRRDDVPIVDRTRFI